MLELLPLAFLNTSEIVLGIVLVIASIMIAIYLFKMKKASFGWGFILITLWNILETVDEFFVKEATRELIFNIGGRIVLIAGIIVLIFTMRVFSKK